MNRKDRRRNSKQGAKGAVAAPPTAPPSTARGFGGDDALAWLTGRRAGAPAPQAPPASAATVAPSPPGLSEGKIATSVYFKALDSLRAAREPSSLTEAVAGMQNYVERVWAEHRPAVEARKTPGFACAAGCAWCCYQQVSVAPAEAVAIARHLVATLPPVTLAALRQRIAELDDRTRGLGVAARAQLKTACAFLADGKCSIYPVRPLRCRGVYSRDADHCRWAQEHPEKIFGDPTSHGKPGPYPVEPAKIMDAALSGLARACQEFGLAWEGLELTAAMRIALDTSDIGERYIKGETVFAGAELPANRAGGQHP
jgi:hypothetical protein